MERLNRRDFLATTGAGSLAAMTLDRTANARIPDAPPSTGRLKQSVSRWCFGGMSLEQLCEASSAMGLKGIDLLSEGDWGIPPRFGMTCAVANGPSTIPDGFNRVENHDRLEQELARMLPLAKAAGIPNMVVFSGNRRGMPDAEGLANCAKGLRRVTPLAERHGVTLVMELLNSRVDHGDYMCDRTPWGVELVGKVGSDRFRLLYDIYHMQIMEGDVIRTIRTHRDAIAHYHTAGNPGRNELDATQELNYRAICEAIADTGFTGFLAHEFIPKRDPVTSLREAVATCTV